VINSDGTPERDFIYIDDAVDAYLAVADSLGEEAHRGRAWNAGSGTPVSIADLVGRLTAASGKDLEPDVRGTPDPEAPIDRQYLDSAPIARELGWQARTDLDSGLTATYSWYAEHAS
jgi:CDP-glucose 4,6-dehydratase